MSALKVLQYAYRWNSISSNPSSPWPRPAASAGPRGPCTPPSRRSAARSRASRASSARGSSSATGATWSAPSAGQLLLPLAQAIITPHRGRHQPHPRAGRRRVEQRAVRRRGQRHGPAADPHSGLLPRRLSRRQRRPHREGRRPARGGGGQRRTRLRGHDPLGLEPGRRRSTCSPRRSCWWCRRTTSSPS